MCAWRQPTTMELSWDDKIGRGAFADIWLARDILDRRIAVKFFNDADPSRVEQNALAHAQALVRVEHSAVVRVFAVEKQRHPEKDVDSLAILMEFVDGPPLSQAGEITDLGRVRGLADNVTDALTAIHDAGLVHGDLHDGNILIGRTGAKVADILYTHSLAEVGSLSAQRSRADDLRALAGIIRSLLSKTGCDAPRLTEAYFHASNTASTAKDVRACFASLLGGAPFAVGDVPSAQAMAATAAGTAFARSARPVVQEREPFAGRALALIAKLQSKAVPLSECVAETLTLAIAVKDEALRSLCEQEIIGYPQQGTGGPITDPRGLPKYRALQFYVAVDMELNMDYFESGEAAIAWLQRNPRQAVPLTVFFPRPIAQIERDAASATLKNVLAIRMKAGALIADTNIPEAPVYCYAKSSALSDLVEGLRARLTSDLVRITR
jgi:tRNA A-37 threonylcarbamoyl transferase component Bud32